MKKIFALALAACMILCMFAGCGGNTVEDNRSYDSYFEFYDYEKGDYVTSNVATYQAVTGTACELSSLDFRFLDEDYEYTVTGYDARYGVFIYDYSQSDFDEYVSYLKSRGFVRVDTVNYTQGTSYFYMNEDTGHIIDMFVADGNGFIAIEPFMNRDLT